MALLGIDHVQLSMPAGREAEARGFYEGLLGVPEQPKPPELAGRGGCWFENGVLKLHLGVEADFRPSARAHVAFRVSGLAELSARLAQAGHALSQDRKLEGYERIFVNDPFGNRLELMEPTA